MISGERIRLRAIEREDLPLFQTWLNDPEVRQGLSLVLPLSMADEEQWYEGMLKQPAEEHPLAIEVQREKTWQIIGNCGLMGINWRIRSAELGIFIGDKTYWDQGFGTEATRLMLRHAFETFNLNRVFLWVMADNHRAIRAYEKVGFVFEGKMRQAEYRDGVYVDLHLMSVLRSEWKDISG